MEISAELFEEIIEALKSDSQRDRDKRLEPRVGLAGEAAVVSVSDRGTREDRTVRIRDVSRSGVGLLVSWSINQGERFVLQLRDRHEQPIWLVCEGAYCRRIEHNLYSVGGRIVKLHRSSELEAMAARNEKMRREDISRISRAILD